MLKDQEAYEPPSLTILGSVEELTEFIDKSFGDADSGITFQGEATSAI